jgi:hypothetical protein
VPDEVCTHFKDLGDYDYRPAREVADADENSEVRSVIDVDILGHIFEQSITDLERLRLSLEHLGPWKTGGRAESPYPPPGGRGMGRVDLRQPRVTSGDCGVAAGGNQDLWRPTSTPYHPKSTVALAA